MVDSNDLFHEGAKVNANIRGIGDIAGQIAWIIEQRAGISFDVPIDPKLARKPIPAPLPRASKGPTVDKSRRPGLKSR